MPAWERSSDFVELEAVCMLDPEHNDELSANNHRRAIERDQPQRMPPRAPPSEEASERSHRPRTAAHAAQSKRNRPVLVEVRVARLPQPHGIVVV
jgi:hypothetical protein